MLINCPISTVYGISLKKQYVFRLNLNQYRNTHYRVLSQSKVSYKHDLIKLNQGLLTTKFIRPVHLTFTLFKPSKRKIDRANVCSIVEKYVCDVLTDLNCWEDDNDGYILSTTYKTGGVDKVNPRVEMLITEEVDELPEPECLGMDLAKGK